MLLILQQQFKMINLIGVMVCWVLVSGDSCGSNCWSCLSVDHCTHCDYGYFLNTAYACEKCSPNCQQCYSLNQCNICSPAHYFNSSASLCQRCPQNCVSCMLNTKHQLLCTQCLVGTYNQSYSCQPCLDYCNECEGPQSCSRCAIGFGYNQQQIACRICGTSCLQCSFPLNQTYICTACHLGYYLKQNSCIRCQPYCLECHEDVCSSCVHGYYNKGSECMVCPAQCSTCKQLQNETVRCVSCENGYYMQDGNCIECVQNCHVCVNSTYCQSCVASHYLTTDHQCERCSDSCISCIAYDNCQKCSVSFYLGEGSCKKCRSECSHCQAQRQCSQCASNSYVLYSNDCLLCEMFLQGCTECANAFVCENCGEGYYLSDGRCYEDSSKLSVLYIILIVLSVVAILGALIYGISKKREMDRASQDGMHGYYEVP